jgi:hypothetical protein
VKKWRALFIGGQKWGVFLVSPKSKHLKDADAPPETRQYGRCAYSQCRIYIANDQDDQAFEDTLLHELLHALLHVTSADDAYDKDAAKEEDLVQKLTPVLHRLLKDLCGFAIRK